MCLIADFIAMLSFLGVSILVVLSLGAVIFVHELGHFFVAKACGVKCEKFFVGFDIGGYKISHRWGETEYGIGILPLGGYVKMLGQDDDPAHIAEQMKKSEVEAASADAVEVTGPGGEAFHVDRRSYLAKSVPQRMAIISAGVIMNVIFAFIFAVIAYGLGVPYMPCIVSDTVPGSPAWQAGLQPGDEILQIGDQVNPSFAELRGDVTLGDLEHGIPCTIRRAQTGQEEHITLTPEKGRGLAKVGIAPPLSLTLAPTPAVAGSPAARARPIETGDAQDKPRPDDADQSAELQGGDTIVGVDGAAVDDYRALAAQLARHTGQPMRLTVERATSVAKELLATVEGDAQAAQSRRLTFELPAQPLRRVGIVPQMGPVTAIQPGSPAAEAGLEVGDRITAVDGQSLAEGDSLSAWDPVTLPQRMQQAAVAGRSVTLSVRRPAAADADTSDDPPETIELTVTPRVAEFFHLAVPPRAPMGLPALGIAYRVESTIAAVVPGSPAAGAQAAPAPGDVLTAARLHFPNDTAGELPDPLILELGPGEPSWPAVFEQLQSSPAGTRLEVDFRRPGTAEQAPEQSAETLTAELDPTDVGDLFLPGRGLVLLPVERIRTATSFGQQLRYGWNETADALTMVFRFLSKLGTQVPISALGGPVTIVTAAGYSAYEGLGKLLVFLTMLSANLAVINFLPIPLLDGGHMVFLAYEGVRGRPANERFVVALHTIGFVFIVSLMLYVLALDFGWFPRNL